MIDKSVFLYAVYFLCLATYDYRLIRDKQEVAAILSKERHCSKVVISFMPKRS